jgi:hypothetical protein
MPNNKTPRFIMSNWPKEWTGAKHPAVVLAEKLSDLDRLTSPCEYHEAAAMLRRIPELEGQRDRWMEHEKNLSAAYVRVREAIGAMNPPSLETEAMWAYVEQTAKDMQAELTALRAQGARVPDGFKLVAVKGFDGLMYWMQRCADKGHLENCFDLVEPWASFEWEEVSSDPTAPQAEQPPYTTIDMGHGKWEVGAGHNNGTPCIAFGRNGTGKVGEPITTEPRQMSVEETFAVITFANVDGLDVLQEKMDEVRAEFFPGTVCQFTQPTDTPQSAPSAKGAKA